MEKVLCGVDLGGTKLSIGLVSNDGRLIDKRLIYDHKCMSEDMVIEQIALSVKQLLKSHQYSQDNLLGVGLGFAGHLRFADGVIITTSNLSGFKGYPIRDRLQAYFKVPVIIDNDANAQAYGEFQFGAGKGYSDFIFLTLSTGIGAGIVINRKVYRGFTGTAGELGHTIIDPRSEFRCTCGNKGCFMACASGLVVADVYRKKVKEGKKSLMIHEENFDFRTIDGKFIKTGFENGDPVSIEIINEFAAYTGIGLYNIFQTFNPPLIILGGGLTHWGDHYLNGIKKKFYSLVGNMLYDPIEINLALLNDDAGLIGAAALTKEIFL